MDFHSSNIETLDDCVAGCEKLTEEMKSNEQSSWAKRMQSVDSAWEGSRATIFNAVLESHAILHQILHVLFVVAMLPSYVVISVVQGS